MASDPNAREIEEAMIAVAKLTMADPVHRPVFIRLKALHEEAKAKEAQERDLDSLIASMAA